MEVSKTGKSIGSVSGGDDPLMLLVAWAEPYANPVHRQANANLIAAAPDLLEALQLFIDAQILTEHHQGVARAAISKALGEE